MALVPHKIVALNELNEGEKNTISSAVVSLFDADGNAATLFDDELGGNGSTTKQTDSQGVVVVYVEPGEYDEQVNGGIQRRVLIGRVELTTLSLVQSAKGYRTGDVVSTVGFQSAGDVGGAEWIATGTTGLTPSQTPSDRGAAELVDGAGRLWVIYQSSVDARVFGPDYGASIQISAAGGIPVEINEASDANIDAGSVDVVMQNINLITANQELNINLPVGEHIMSDFVDFTNPTGNNININGFNSSSISVSSISVVSSASHNHVIDFEANNHGLSAGEYVYINIGSLAGTGRFKEIAGCWRVVGVPDTNTLRIKHTHSESVFPSMTASFTVRPLRTVLRWGATRGLSVSGSTLKSLSKVCLAGDFNISTESASDGPLDGLLVGDQANTEDTGSSLSESHYNGSVFCNAVGVVEWRNNGVQVIGGRLKVNGFAVSSCGHRGIQSAGNGTVNAKFSASVGNSSSGYEAEASGSLNAAGSISAGNAEQGVYAIGAGHVVFSSDAYSGGNNSYGLDSRDGGFISANTSETSNNGIGAINANLGSVTIESGVVSGAVSASYSANVQMAGATGAVTVSKDSSSTVIMFSNKEFGGWNEFTPIFTSVTYSDAGSLGYFRESGGIANFTIDLNYTGLDTSDNSVIAIRGFPEDFEYSYGQVDINVLASDGYSMTAGDTFRAAINTATSRSILISDSSGTRDEYNNGRMQASGRLVISGWVKTEF